MPVTVPPSLMIVLEVLRPCFTAPSFATMSALVTGALSADGARTVTGMWQAAGLAGRVHWSSAHRFFSRAVWDLDRVGLALAGAVVARFMPEGGAVTVAVDDTLFHRYGKKVHGSKYQHDGSAKGRDGIGRGNCFVIVGIVVAVPFLARQVCLPVLFRLHIPKTTASKTEQARALVDLLAAALPDRTIHVVGDALYRGPVWRGLPRRVTFTTRLAANAVLGGISVLVDLHPLAIQGHLLLALAALAVNFLLVARCTPPRPDVELSPRTMQLVWGIVAGTSGAIVAGTLVTGSGPHAGDENAPRLDLDIESIARVHGVLVMATIATVIALAARISKRPSERTALTDAVSIWLFVGLLQAAIGYIQYFNGLPVLLVGAHVGGAAAITLATTHLVLRARPCYGNGSTSRTLEVGAAAT